MDPILLSPTRQNRMEMSAVSTSVQRSPQHLPRSCRQWVFFLQVRRSDRVRRQANSFRRPSKPFQSLTHLACFPGSASGKEPACQCRRQKRLRFNPWVGKIPWRRAWQPTPAFLPGESHGPRSLAGYTWGCKELDTTEAT